MLEMFCWVLFEDSPHLPIQLSAYTSGREMSGEFVYKGFSNSETSSYAFRMEAKATLHVIMCTILRFYETALATKSGLISWPSVVLRRSFKSSIWCMSYLALTFLAPRCPSNVQTFIN